MFNTSNVQRFYFKNFMNTTKQGLRFRVNWICAIITSSFLKHTIIIQETMPIPLQLFPTLKYAIMDTGRHIGPTFRHPKTNVLLYGHFCPC